jgi:hypothetical protein
MVPPKFKFTLLEALSATGLRAIRYAKEIPLLKYACRSRSPLPLCVTYSLLFRFLFSDSLSRTISLDPPSSISAATLNGTDSRPKVPQLPLNRTRVRLKPAVQLPLRDHLRRLKLKRRLLAKFG